MLVYNCYVLSQHIEAALGKTIKGQLDKMDSGIIYTDSYVSRYINYVCEMYFTAIILLAGAMQLEGILLKFINYDQNYV